jgi:hypothetical protein
MTDDDRPKSILELPPEFAREVVLDVALLPDALLNHLLVTIDQVITVLHATYPDQLAVEHEDEHLIVYRTKDTGEQMRILESLQNQYDRNGESHGDL